MTKQELQEIFESPFDWDNWRKVMDFVFPEFRFSAQKIPVESFTKAAEEQIQGFYHHGSTSLTDHISLNLYEVELKESVNLPRNVKGIRKFISSEAIANTQASIAVFYSPDKSKWRFTLAQKQLDENFKETDRKPESYTYVFGEGERGRTAAERFYDLSKIEKKKLKDLEVAFSVEALSKKFFAQYKEVYLEFVDNIKGNPSRLGLFKAQTKEEQEKLARDFVKKMMGRIVFLYFLQKKGWMGCKSKWLEGEDLFMQKLFEAAPKDGSFYLTYLQPLFFDTLNAKRAEGEEDCVINGANFGKVPFLNGGLFEREENHPDNLTLDWEIFNRFFEILNNYNFTIIEDDPDFKEIAVDPEMLGHIFENLLEDNKDKGAFYTPKEIVQYMCQESLIEYLNTQLSKNIKDEALKDAIRDFVVKQDFVALNDISQRADQYVLQALRDIKVCDPAIGSGAFPMGILHEIYRMVEYLQEDRDIFLDIWDKKAWDAARVKEDIIQNSIYGVDIEKGAVDIARLRFWLSIIIDEEEPKPLPNLDYKIVVGNSLLNKFEDHVIDIEWEVEEGAQANTKTQEFLEKRSQLLEEISDKQKTYFDTESSNRASLSQEIKDLKIDILINQLEMKIVAEGTENEPKIENFRKRNVFVKAQKLYFQTLEWKRVIVELESIRGTDKPFNHFDWSLDFPELLNPIINRRRNGFDLVIGNPPYIPAEGLTEIEKRLYEERYKVAKGRINVFTIFYEHALMKSKEGGIISLITPYTLMKNKYYEDTRRMLVDESNIVSLLDFSEYKIFENAVVDNIILIYKNEVLTKSDTITYLTNIKSLEKGIYNQKIVSKKFIKSTKDYSFNVSPHAELISKCYLNSEPVAQVIDFKQGIITGDNNEFVVDDSSIHMAKPLLSGRDFNKFIVNYDNKYVVYDKSKLHRPRVESVFETSLKILLRQTGSYPIAAIDSNSFYTLDTVHNGKVINTEYEPNYLLGIINSKLFKFLYQEMINEKGKVFAQVKIMYIDPIPIKKIDRSIQLLISNLVSKITTQKMNLSDTSVLEDELDGIIFKLYNLSFEELLLVDPEFKLSEEQYNNLLLEDLKV